MNRSKTFDVKNFKSQPIYWSRLGFPYDPPTLKADGSPMVFSEDQTRFLKYHKQFLDCGVKIHTSILFSGWVGVNEYDYTFVDSILDGIMNLSKDILYMPRIKLNPPLEWLKQNPEDVFCYYNAPKDKEEIAALVGTLKQDILGYESETGYYGAGGSIDNRPNLSGIIGMQSISSKKWIDATTIALSKLIKHIEQKPYADRIIGYQVCFGPSGEVMYWGRASSRYGDYGINALKNFYDFGLKKYGDEEVLKNLWKQPDLTRDNLTLPSPFDRYGENKNTTLRDLFRANNGDKIIIDYDEFLSETVCNALEHFAGTAKQLSGGKLVGGFYGYILEVGNCNYAGHLSIERLLNSPYIDFFAAPASYENRKDGESGATMIPTASINLKKQWVDETDLRTYIAKDSNKKFSSSGKEGTKCSLWREVCKNLTQDSGFWWMDLGGGWYDDEFILDEIKSITKFVKEITLKQHKSISDVLIVVDENSYYKLKENDGLRKAFLSDFIAKARKSGFIADVFRLNDLKSINLEKYKLVVFANTYLISKEQLEKFNFNKNVNFMFNYASGIWGENQFSIDNVKRLTGYAISENGINNSGFPELKIDGENFSIASKFFDGRKVYLNINPDITEKEIYNIANNAGCNTLVDSGLTIYGDNRILYVSSKDGYNGEIYFGKGVKVKDYFSGDEYVEKTRLNLEKYGFKIYVKI